MLTPSLGLTGAQQLSDESWEICQREEEGRRRVGKLFWLGKKGCYLRTVQDTEGGKEGGWLFVCQTSSALDIILLAIEGMVLGAENARYFVAHSEFIP